MKKLILIYSVALGLGLVGAALYHQIFNRAATQCDIVTVDIGRLLSASTVKDLMAEKKATKESPEVKKRLLPSLLDELAESKHWVLVDKACVLSGGQDVTDRVVALMGQGEGDE